jgi:Tfp pilus assembly protein PilP
MMRTFTAVCVSASIGLASGILSVSCEEGEAYRDFTPAKSGPGLSGAAARRRTAGSTGLIEQKPDTTKTDLELPQLTETAFIDGPTRRDPFMPFLEVIKKQDRAVETIQRKVKLKEYDIAELKLIGIITNIGDPRAMVTTPDNTGYVIKRGDFVGRADYVTQGNNEEVIQVNWRVARIHGTGKEEERGVYLVRDDPTTSRGVDVTRFIPLHPIE